MTAESAEGDAEFLETALAPSASDHQDDGSQ
jgi:hypothetical protein